MELLFTLLNTGLLIAACGAALWVWRDAARRGDPWGPTWALATLLLFPLALPAYLLRLRATP